MARAGITKYSVEKARETLVAKGLNSSIDAIRVELGNTGSKTTISRYLKELEAEETVQLEDEALLSEGIKAIIARLASKLHQEAKEIVSQSEGRYQERINALMDEDQKLKLQAGSQASQIENSNTKVSVLSEEINDLNGQLVALQTRLNQASAQVHELETVLTEKDKQIEGLKESHQHTRDNLTHYRESVKEQREQERRQHEQQVQQLQSELRQLNQTLIVKQGDITELNKDNSRLVTELHNNQKHNRQLDDKLNQSELALQSIRSEQQSILAKLESTQFKLADSEKISKTLITDGKIAIDELEANKIALIKLETELSVKDKLLQQLSGGAKAS